MLINEFWKIPFLRFIIPFIAGILFASFFPISLVVLLSLTTFFIGLSIVYRPFLNHEQSYHKRWIFGFLTSLSLFLVGAYLTTSKSVHSNNILKAETIVGVIDEPPKETKKSIKLILKASEYQTNDVWENDYSKLLVYIEKDSLSKSLSYGDLILIKGKLQQVKNAGNPHEFNYKQYLNRKQIYFQSYQNRSEWTKLSSGKGNLIYSIAYQIRTNVLNIYKSSGISGDEFAILAALTLGVKDYLSDEIVEAYSDSGAMHILAVSGLHVGILTIVLGIILFPLKKSKKLRILQAIIIILLIWFFALITGLAPSVTRASLMFTFVIIGKNSGRKPSIYNTLAASAFLILVFKPLAIFHVGFQLSYLAVLSIVLIQPRLYNSLDIKNRVLDYLWKLTTVSLAAQIGTAPISIFYFHKFPVYAVFTNFIAIHAALIIMVGALLLICFSFFGPLVKYLALGFSYVIQYINKSISFIENLPSSSIEYISLSNVELFCIYLAFALIFIFLVTKKRNLVFIVFGLFIIAFGVRNYMYFRKLDVKQFSVFNTNRSSSFATISSKKMTLYADSSLLNNKKSIGFLSSNIITNEFVSKFEIEPLSLIEKKSSNKFPAKFIYLDTLKVIYIFDKTDRFKSNKKLNTNYLIVNNNATLNIENLKSLFVFEKLIIDSSVPKWKQEVLKKDCKKHNIPYHNVAEQGAFTWQNNLE